MDRLQLDYGELGAVVRAGFATPDASLRSSAAIATGKLFTTASPRSAVDDKAAGLPAAPASDAGHGHSGFHSFQLPSFSTAFDLLPSLNSPTPLQFSLSGDSVFPASGGTARGLIMPAPSTMESLCSISSQNSELSRVFCPSLTATQRNFCSSTPESAMETSARPNAVVLHQPRDIFTTLCQNIFNSSDPLSATRSVLSSLHTSSSASTTEMQAAGVFPCPSSNPGSFLRSPLISQPKRAMAVKNINDGVEKRSAETELAMAALEANSNRARGTKRRKLLQKRVVQVPAIAAASSKPGAGENVPSDMWAWRKYGQKPIKGSPHPRNYYRCSSSKGCPARKQVERNPNEPSMLILTYTSDHNHPWPPHRISPLAGSARACASKSSFSSAAIHELSPICSSELSCASPLSEAPSAKDGDVADCAADSPTKGSHGAGLPIRSGSPSPSPLPTTSSGTHPPRPILSISSGACSGEPYGVKIEEAISRHSDLLMEQRGDAGSLGSASSRGEFAWSCGDGALEDKRRMLDSLLSEMLDDVQKKQNNGDMEMMMTMRKDDDDDELFSLPGSFNFVSQVNHLVQ